MNRPFKKRALVAQMTLEEKASQLRYDAPAIERLGAPAYNWWNEGLHGVVRAGAATVFPQAIALTAMFDCGLDAAAERASAVHLTWYPSARAGKAVAELLFGERSPSASCR